MTQLVLLRSDLRESLRAPLAVLFFLAALLAGLDLGRAADLSPGHFALCSAGEHPGGPAGAPHRLIHDCCITASALDGGLLPNDLRPSAWYGRTPARTVVPEGRSGPVSLRLLAREGPRGPPASA